MSLAILYYIMMGLRTERVNKTADRRTIRIAALIRERRGLSKSLTRLDADISI